jgi:hypothetical protein
MSDVGQLNDSKLSQEGEKSSVFVNCSLSLKNCCFDHRLEVLPNHPIVLVSTYMVLHITNSHSLSKHCQKLQSGQ